MKIKLSCNLKKANECHIFVLSTTVFSESKINLFMVIFVEMLSLSVGDGIPLTLQMIPILYLLESTMCGSLTVSLWLICKTRVFRVLSNKTNCIFLAHSLIKLRENKKLVSAHLKPQLNNLKGCVQKYEDHDPECNSPRLKKYFQVTKCFIYIKLKG